MNRGSLQSVISALSNGVIVLDADGEVVAASPAAAALWEMVRRDGGLGRLIQNRVRGEVWSEVKGRESRRIQCRTTGVEVEGGAWTVVELQDVTDAMAAAARWRRQLRAAVQAKADLQAANEELRCESEIVQSVMEEMRSGNADLASLCEQLLEANLRLEQEKATSSQPLAIRHANGRDRLRI